MQKIIDKIIKGGNITPAEAKRIYNLSDSRLPELLFHTDRIRKHFKGNKIDLCAVINAKSGRCSENCKFCAQSSHYRTKVKTYPLLKKNKIISSARDAKSTGAKRFGVVTSGKTIFSEKEWHKILETISELSKNKKTPVTCASLGSLDYKKARRLKKAGLKRYHHNLETAESFFKKICATHTFKERLKTISNAQKAGLEICCGGIFGLGETKKQRLELAFTIKKLNVDSVPLNFLTPAPGTPLEKQKPLPPLEILKTIAIFRMILPDKDIRVCGGRETNLRATESLMFWAGANATMIGNYLTTRGHDPEYDLQMIKDLGLKT
jgi:biotin synthase